MKYTLISLLVGLFTLTGCATSHQFSTLDVSPVSVPLIKTSNAIHEAQTQVGAFRHGVALRDEQISTLRTTLQVAENQTALAQQAVVNLHAQAVVQATEANKQVVRADKAEKKLTVILPHLVRLRIAVTVACLLGGVFYFLGPAFKLAAGPYAILIPSALAGLASIIIGALLLTGAVWLLALFGIL